MASLSIAAPPVTKEGAEDIKRGTLHIAAGLARLISASGELKIPEVLGELPAEYLGQIGRVMRAESRANQVMELVHNGKSISAAAREVGITAARANQIVKDNSGKLRDACETILDFIYEHGWPENVYRALEIISTPAARKMFSKLTVDEE